MPNSRPEPPAVPTLGRALLDSELRLRLLATASSTAIYRMSPDWQAMHQLSGEGFLQDATQPDPQWIETYIPAQDRPKVLAAIAKAIAERAIFELEHRVWLPDGRFGWTLSRAVPIFDDHGEISEWFGAAVDVTQQHEMMARLRESESAFKTIADTVPQLVWVADQNGRFEFFNQRWHDYFGETGQQEAFHWYAETCVHPDDIAAAEQGFAQARASGQVFESEHRLRHHDGSYRWFMVRAQPYRDPESGALLRWYGTAVDVHDRHDAEQQLRTFNQALEVQVQTGSRDLQAAEAQMRQMQKLEAIGLLTGGVAHDFNNLLTVIRNAAELMRRKPLPAERQQRYLDAILDTTDRAAKLTSQLLAFARRQALRPEVFAVLHQVEQIAEMLRSIVGAHMQVLVQGPAQPCYIEADLNQFETALVNLVVNARDAMQGQGTITLTLEATDDQVTIAVTDDGHGIAAADLERIFDPFYTTKEVGKGTGLGLSQVYGFVHQSGGAISVQSTPGQGTTFTVSLPAVAAPAPDLAATPEATLAKPKGRILVVEDNLQVREFTANLLADMGYATSLAHDSISALALLEAGQPRIDLVLSDVVMPGVSGMELARTIKRRWPDIALVLTSGYSQVLADDAQPGVELLNKPYSAEQLLRAFEAATKRS
ncbi:MULTISPECIES: hybrid sensor histidine kinase/response regulator [Pseudomonas]|uniref:histidine kinase n=1 Tax=Pseudomonas entomophila TaxID=312306 RepID=A0A3S8UIM8_9PSED|nr:MULTISPECIES: PAS domain-containing sensor histidine kinase [Pseudomonas]AZL68143.1 PAS domain-containing sensor histidine kinase [Pseudomonas oryziphila]MDZ4017192.1 Sensor histidine kinase RcsC [Pseudomonas sichuanensis]UVL91244.1 PAS domain-containing protein [Pseudomonas sichuanensis]